MGDEPVNAVVPPCVLLLRNVQRVLEWEGDRLSPKSGPPPLYRVFMAFIDGWVRGLFVSSDISMEAGGESRDIYSEDAIQPPRLCCSTDTHHIYEIYRSIEPKLKEKEILIVMENTKSCVKLLPYIKVDLVAGSVLC